MNISKESVVTLHYTLKDDQGHVLDSSTEKDPLVYLHGTGSMIPALEEALEGRKSGDQLQVTIPPEKGYGLRDETQIKSVPKSEFKNAARLKVGMQFQVNTEEGPILLSVLDVKDDEVVVDGNHPLAGMTLHFDVKVADVRKATEEELQHGHAHGEGGHHHH